MIGATASSTSACLSLISSGGILCVYPAACLGILRSKFFCIVHHFLNLLLSQTSLVIFNCDFLLAAAVQGLCFYCQNTIGINFKRHLHLGLSSWFRRDARQSKFT